MKNNDRILYLECGTGISGDMTVAALLDLGADQDKLLQVLKGIPGNGFEAKISRVKKAGIDCCDFDVILDEAHDGHDHDMDYLYGHLHEHGHDHDHELHGMKEIREIIAHLSLTDGARALALRIFEILAQAESEAHGVPVDEVHFHEVGALDSIVDIVAAAVCLDDLGIEKVAVTGITEGSGTVRCQHGILQVPVPAVERIARAHALPLHFTTRKGELVTPTGAAIAAAVMTQQALPEKFVIVKTGLGAGKREYEIPSILRAMILEPCEEAKDIQSDRIWKLECDMDDCTGEQLGYALGRLFDEGAREAHYAPIFMKKNRPGWELTVVCDEAQRDQIRRQQMERSVLTRKTVCVKTRYGEIPVKVSGENTHQRIHPEYEMVAAAAVQHGVSFGTVYEEVLTQMLSAGSGA